MYLLKKGKGKLKVVGNKNGDIMGISVGTCDGRETRMGYNNGEQLHNDRWRTCIISNEDGRVMRDGGMCYEHVGRSEWAGVYERIENN